ncbi:conjugal transfer protein [Rhodococcus qingshengii]|uniref:conjugal transfer protein n=1 Tax=Rhodococcus qingshengii TaxID=334542 RepID=UPI00287F71E6|nr:conjugal transfer protein [Rhodococcus qingshengii]
MPIFERIKIVGRGAYVRMKKSNAQQFSDASLVRTIKRTTYLSYITLIMVVAVSVAILLKPSPQIPDVAREVSTMQRVQFFSTNFLTVWLTGTERDAPTVKQMVSDTSVLPAKWGTESVEISDLNVADVKRSDGDSEVVWWVKLGVTLVPPTSGTPQRQYYMVTVIEKDEALRALTMPRLVEHSRPSVDIGPDYDSSVSVTSSLGTAVSAFSSAYFTAGEGTLGRYVSSSFQGGPIPDSPYTSADVLAVRTTGAVNVDQHEVGESVRILATVRAGFSMSTFHTMDVPMTVHRTDNGTWQIDSVDTLVAIADQPVIK